MAERFPRLPPLKDLRVFATDDDGRTYARARGQGEDDKFPIFVQRGNDEEYLMLGPLDFVQLKTPSGGKVTLSIGSCRYNKQGSRCVIEEGAFWDYRGV